VLTTCPGLHSTVKRLHGCQLIIRKHSLNFTNCCLSQFKEDTGILCSPEINPITYLLQTDTGSGFEPRSYHCPSKYINQSVTRSDTHSDLPANKCS